VPDALTLPDARECLESNDTDFDGRNDVIEGCLELRDTDGDGMLDMNDTDSDNDGLHDETEDVDGDGQVDPGETDPLLTDSDGDFFEDGCEAYIGTDPTDPASVPGPLLVLPFGPTSESIDVTFATEGAPAGPVDVEVQIRNDSFGLIQTIDPPFQTLATPGLPVTFTITGFNQSLMPPIGFSSMTTADLWLNTTGGIGVDIVILYILVPASP
jgi:hypothetical protein